MKTHIVMIRQIFFADGYEGELSDLAKELSKLPDTTLQNSSLFSLQTSDLPESHDILVILVNMSVRYQNVYDYLQAHAMTVVEFLPPHNYTGPRNEMGMEVARPYADLDDALKQIIALQ